MCVCVCVCVCVRACVKSLQLHLTLCDPVDCSPPGSSVRGILQARILEWVAMLFDPNPGIKPASLQSPALAGQFFTADAACEAHQSVLTNHQERRMIKSQASVRSLYPPPIRCHILLSSWHWKSSREMWRRDKRGPVFYWALSLDSMSY